MRRWAAGTLAVIATQAALVGGWWWVEQGRAPSGPFASEPLDEPAPALEWRRPDRRGALPDGLVVVHFWATWCAPCRRELPGLLAAARDEGVALVAVTDEDWPAVERWFGGEVPAAIVRDPTGEVARTWRVSGLPDTFLVRDRRVVGRVGGARDWSGRAARDWLAGR